MSGAAIFGLAGPRLSAPEAAFFGDADPWGFILFGRNIETPAQVGALTDALRQAVGREAPILIDQEGGAVQRLRPPHWLRHPPASAYGRLRVSLEEKQALVRLGARLIAHELADVGIDVDCLPVLDVPAAGAHRVIGDRAYAEDPETVTALGRAACEGLLAGGVLPVIKHIPGHGRAGADSHHHLPVVGAALAELQASDFAPFAALAGMPIAMTAHVVFAAIDPAHAATVSASVISQVIRGFIGFEGLLISDDIGMQALAGAPAQRAAAALAAGCDLVLHCSGEMAEMAAVAEAAGTLRGKGERRAEAALARRRRPAAGFDAGAAAARLDAALAQTKAA